MEYAAVFLLFSHLVYCAMRGIAQGRLPRSAAPIMTYGERLFARPAFIESMTPNERVMRR